MRRMKQLAFLFLVIVPLLYAAELTGVRTVYVLPMSHGMDQYLANRISSQHVFRVVTDPKLADAVLSDHVGDALQSEIDELLPNPEPEKRIEPAKDEKDPAKGEKDKDAKGPAPSLAEMMADSEGRPTAQRSTLGRGRGTIFLVDLKSRQVVWSIFEPSKGMDSRELDRTASDIVSRLSKDLNPAKK